MPFERSRKEVREIGVSSDSINRPPKAFQPYVSNSRNSSVIRGLSQIYPPGTQTPNSHVTHTSFASQGENSNSSFSSSVQQEEAKLRWNADEELKKMSKELLRLQKWCLIVGLAVINGVLIFVAWSYWQVYYLFIVLLSSNTVLQASMILCIVGHLLITKVFCFWLKRKENVPSCPETMVMLLPCYNETHEELSRSLDSLIEQNDIDEHPRLIFIVVDGNVKGPGMEKTTQEYLMQDILQPSAVKHFENGYRARDGLFMPVKIQTGFFKGIPYVLVGKRYNQGKRDSLCFARSFIYHFCKRSENAVTMFSNELFEYIGGSFVQNGLEHVDYLVGMDADTVFEENCIREMVLEIRKNPKLVGVCGHVCVDFDGNNFGPWSLYQSVEYSQTQGLRRMFQSRITGKVNCLPGCCQLIRVDEATFGDEVLRERFGYCPKPNDVMTQHIMGNYSEDSIHASIIFSLFPKKQTAQALRAKAFTIVPQNWKVFLSQRKRWALGSISNEFVMIFRPGIILVERLQSVVAVVTWAITPFIIAAFVELIILLVRRGREAMQDPMFLGLICILWMRYVYSFCIGFWLPRNNLERLQYFIGFFFHFMTSPFMNIIILVYSLFHSDDFKWGKTREVVGDDSVSESDQTGCRREH
ncbi:Putative Glycosyltransferase family 2 [[Torrubiella] hemipterigena]|uniref:chitin synthase n=1 Tax=[Torrubiella] hemipterigena TaxID=1531966 RepID=A0A0A1T7Q2_9HYPO|nr:Putative Glycosyltransferase family 2 [[Torrubiella] hemipterigena]